MYDDFPGGRVATLNEYLPGPSTNHTVPENQPSGTEPKLKLYIAVRGASLDKAEARADAIEATARRILPVLQDED
jgi:hypothetical protein